MSIYDFTATNIQGETVSLQDWKGKVLLIVNTATKCGFAPQFHGLQQLHEQYGPDRFAVLGFPSSQFANQELDNDSDIEQSCQLNFGVKFPLFSKVDVKGEHAHPLFTYLTNEAKGVFGTKAIKWNFTKFLIDQQGEVVRRFAPKDTPASIAVHIEQLLKSTP